MSFNIAVGLHYALNCTIFDATVAPIFSPDSTNTRHGSPCLYSRFHAFMLWQVPHLCQLTPTRMSNSATMCLSSSCSHPPCYLQERDEIVDDVIIAPSRNRYVKVTVITLHPLTVPSSINPWATVTSIKVLFRGVKASIHTRFALAHALVLGILHYHECHIAPMQGILPVSQLNATVRAAFIPDSTLEFLPIFSSSKCTKSSIFSDFLHS